MDRPWFDEETDLLLIDEYIVEMDSYKRIVEDKKITDTELLEQTLRVVTLLRRLEEALSSEAKALAKEALGEMAVLNALQALRLQASSALPLNNPKPAERRYRLKDRHDARPLTRTKGGAPDGHFQLHQDLPLLC